MYIIGFQGHLYSIELKFYKDFFFIKWNWGEGVARRKIPKKFSTRVNKILGKLPNQNRIVTNNNNFTIIWLTQIYVH